MAGNVSRWTYATAQSPYEYFVNASKLSDYTTAKKACVNVGGMLVSILSNATQAFLEQIVPRKPTAAQARHYWIGAVKESDHSSWLWQDGKKLSYSAWDHSNEINQTNERCSTMWAPRSHKWLSQSCLNDRYGYICQRKQNSEC